MNEFTKENKHLTAEKLLEYYRENIKLLDKTIAELQEQRMADTSSVRDLCLFFGNYSSGTKTIISRYLNECGVSNKQIKTLSTVELIVMFKKSIAIDKHAPCNLTSELHMISFDLRNRLAHHINQESYLGNVIEKSGIKKITRFLSRLSGEAKEIENHYLNKVNLSKINAKANSQEVMQEKIHPFGITY